jgi:hypothetical protein
MPYWWRRSEACLTPFGGCVVVLLGTGVRWSNVALETAEGICRNERDRERLLW